MHWARVLLAVTCAYAQQYRGQVTSIVNRRASCDDDNFHFYIEFAAPFGGKIYARNTPECTYVNSEIDRPGET